MENQKQNELPGLDFVFDTGVRRIEDQQKLIETIDIKMGVLIGFLGAFIVGLLAGLFALQPGTINSLLSMWSKLGLFTSVILIGFSVYKAFQAFRLRCFYSGIRFTDLVKWTNEETSLAKTKFLPTLIQTIDDNEMELTKKRRHANHAIWTIFFGLIVLLVSLIEVGTRIL